MDWFLYDNRLRYERVKHRSSDSVSNGVSRNLYYIRWTDIIRSFILHTNIKQKFRLIQLNECNLSSKGDMGRCNTLVRGADQ